MEVFELYDNKKDYHSKKRTKIIFLGRIQDKAEKCMNCVKRNILGFRDYSKSINDSYYFCIASLSGFTFLSIENLKLKGNEV